MNVETRSLEISEIRQNPDNPRTIKKAQLEKLVKSLNDFPEMQHLREIVVDETLMILGGNMRYQALKKSGAARAIVKVCQGLTAEQKREFIIKDNSNFGEWNMEVLAADWGDLPLSDWGLDIPDTWKETDYTRNIEAPIYSPSDSPPAVTDLFDDKKARQLSLNIEKAPGLPQDIKDFLLKAAYRHTVFNYKRIADFYAHADQATQALMEESGLVIIDFNKALELGYVKLAKNVAKQYAKDNPDETT